MNRHEYAAHAALVETARRPRLAPQVARMQAAALAAYDKRARRRHAAALAVPVLAVAFAVCVALALVYVSPGFAFAGVILAAAACLVESWSNRSTIGASRNER